MSNLDVDPSQDFDAGAGVASQPEVLAPEAAATETQPEQRAVAQKTFSTSETGLMTLQTLAEQKSYARQLMKEGMVSDSFKTPEQVVIGIQYALAIKIHPSLLLPKMYVVKGKPSLFGEAPLGLCHSKGVVADIVEFFIDENGEQISYANKNVRKPVFGAVTQFWRVGQERMQEDFFTLDDLKRAGIDYGKGKNGAYRKDTWEKFERIMMRYKARTIALRTKCPDVISGIPIAEYDDHFSPDTPEIDVSKETTVADEINNKYLSKPEGDA